MTKRKYRTDEEWLSLIQECRLSGLTDKMDIQCLSPVKKYKLGVRTIFGPNVERC